MSAEQATNKTDASESLPLLEQLEEDKLLPPEPVQCASSTESLLNTASTLLANITATSLLPSTSLHSKLPELPLLPAMSMNSLLLAAASNDILSTLTSTLSPSLEPISSESPQLGLTASTPPQPLSHTVTQSSASIQPPTPPLSTQEPSSSTNLLASVQSLIQAPPSSGTPSILPSVDPTQPSVGPSQSSLGISQPSIVPNQPSIVPTQPSIVPTQPSIIPDQPSIVPTQPSIVPTQPSIIPTQPSIIPTQPSIVPTQPSIVSTQPSIVSLQTSVGGPNQSIPTLVGSSLAKSSVASSNIGLVNPQPLPKPVQAVLLPRNPLNSAQSTTGAVPSIALSPQLKSSSLSQIPLTVSRSKSSVVPARIGQVTAEILTNFQPPLSKPPITLTVKTAPQFKPATGVAPNKTAVPVSESQFSKPSGDARPLPQLRVSAGEILASVTGLSENRAVRVGTPSLQANEQLLSDDESSDEEMDTQQGGDHPLPMTVTQPELPTSSRSDSPYADDDSFASFLAREVHETALEDGSSSSRSPTPSQSADVHSLVSHLQGQGSSGPGLRRFGVTASCPPAPVQLPEEAVQARLDMTSRNFPKRSKYAHRAAMSAMHPYNRTRGGGASVAKTLDLLKAVLQSSFNMEVKRLCDDYLHIFTQAAANIRDNTGDSVPEATLKLLVCKMIEEAQAGYVQGKWEFPYGKLPRSEKLMTPSGSPMSTKKLKVDKLDTRYGPPKRIRKPPADRSSDKSAVWKWGMDKRRLDPEKWEPEKMNLSTVFCLGVNVNKALGHAANRGKVYYLHPELFKYACDGDDKTWLYENKYLPVHGGKAFLMIYKEVATLVSTDESYKEVPEIINSVTKLQQFRVPQFMIDKMKTFMKSVQGYFAQEAGNNGPPVSKP